MTFLRVDMAGLDVLIEDLGDRAEAAARPAAQAAAQVLYDQVKRNVAAIGHVTGNLDQAIYQAYSRERSGPGFATYCISWNKTKAPHGQLVEFGHIQRYASYLGKDGKWHTAYRRGMKGRKPPGRNASQAEKDAFYVPLATPKQIAARSFLRSAFDAKQHEAAAAAEQVLRFHVSINNSLPPG